MTIQRIVRTLSRRYLLWCVIVQFCARGGLDIEYQKQFLPWRGLLNPGTGCSGQQWSRYPQGRLKAMWVWHLGTWISSGLGRVGGTLGLNSLERLFQPKQFCVSGSLYRGIEYERSLQLHRSNCLDKKIQWNYVRASVRHFGANSQVLCAVFQQLTNFCISSTTERYSLPSAEAGIYLRLCVAYLTLCGFYFHKAVLPYSLEESGFLRLGHAS